MKRTADDFACRRRQFVDHHHHFQIFQATAAGSSDVAPRLLTSLRVDDELLALQEFVGEKSRHVEVAAAVAGEVEDKLLHALTFEALYGIDKFVVRRAREATEANVSCLLVDHICSVDAVDGYVVALDDKMQRFRLAAAQHFNFDNRAFRTA